MSLFNRVGVASVFLLCSITTAHAAQGFYFGAGWASNSVEGDFDGKNGFSTSSEVIIVPEIDSGSGFAIFGGWQLNEQWDLEMSYYSSNHNSDWQGFDLDVEYSSLNFDAKFNFNANSENVKPYVLVGYGFGTVTVIDGSSDGFGFGDAEYYGSGLNIGIGVNYYVEPAISFGAAFIKRLTSYDEAEGISGLRGELPYDLDGDATTLTINVAYHIQR